MDLYPALHEPVVALAATAFGVVVAWVLYAVASAKVVVVAHAPYRMQSVPADFPAHHGP